MKAYLLVHRRQITDAERLKKYADGIGETIARYGGKPLVRADTFETLEGTWHPGRSGDDSKPERITVIEFPDMAALKAWYESKEYAPLKNVRQNAAICEIVAVVGNS